jgi:hypothetical protein
MKVRSSASSNRKSAKTFVSDRQFFFRNTDEMRQIDADMTRIETEAKDRFVEGFAELVASKGFGAVIDQGPNGIRGKRWQQRGREMFGKDRFNAAMLRAIERARRSSTSLKT